MQYNSNPFPWKHYILKDFFDVDLYNVVKNEKFNSADYSNITGFRDAIAGRTFLGNPHIDSNKHLEPVAEFLNRREYYEECFKVDLSNTYLRAELIHDRYPFFHDIHLDEPAKKLTIIVNINKEDPKNLATDLYHNKETHVCKTEWVDNGGLAFQVTDRAWHGFAPIEYNGIRTIMIINWVDKNVWRDKSQLYIKD